MRLGRGFPIQPKRGTLAKPEEPTKIKILSAKLEFAGIISRSILNRVLNAVLTFSGVLLRNATHQLVASLSFLGAITTSAKHGFSAVLSFVGKMHGERILIGNAEPHASANWGAGRQIATPFTATESGELTEMAFLTANKESWNWTGFKELSMGVFADNAGQPGVLLGQVHSTSKPTVNNWYRVSGFSIQVQNGVKYWLTLVSVGSELYTQGVALGSQVDKSTKATYTELTETTEWESTSNGPMAIYGLGGGSFLVRHQITPTLTFLGLLKRTVEYLRAGLSFAGALPRNIAYGLSAKTEFLGNLAKTTTHTLSGKVEFLGSLKENASRKLTASLTFLGTLPHNSLRALSGSLSFAGSLPHNVITALAAKLEFRGVLALAGNFVRLLTAKLEFAGVLPRDITKKLTGVLSFAGALPNTAIHALVATLKPGNAFGKKTIGATLDNGFTANFKSATKYESTNAIKVTKLLLYVVKAGAATQKLKPIIYSDNAGVPENLLGVGKEFVYEGQDKEWISLYFNEPITLAANTPYWLGIIVGATIKGFGLKYDSVANARARNENNYESGPTATFGTPTKDAEQISIFAVEDIHRNVTHGLSALLKPVFSALTRAVTHGLTAGLSFLGTLAVESKEKVQALAAKLTFAGQLANMTATKQLQAGLTFLGSLPLRITNGLSAGLTFTGTLPRTIAKKLTGELTFLGALPRTSINAFKAGLTFVGSIRHNVTHALTPSLSFLVALPRNFELTRRFVAVLSFLGNLSLSGKFVEVLKASVSFVGTLRREFTLSRVFAASLSFAGSLPHNIVRGLSALLSFAGSLRSQIKHQLSASLQPTFSKLSFTITHGLTAVLTFAGKVRSNGTQILTATLTFVGSVGRNVTSRLQAILPFIGKLGGRFSSFVQPLTATLSFVGNITKQFVRTLRAVLRFRGTVQLENYLAPRTMIGPVIHFFYRADEVILKREAPSVITTAYELVDELDDYPKVELDPAGNKFVKIIS